jgi:hypothetical protein
MNNFPPHVYRIALIHPAHIHEFLQSVEEADLSYRHEFFADARERWIIFSQGLGVPIEYVTVYLSTMVEPGETLMFEAEQGKLS